MNGVKGILLMAGQGSRFGQEVAKQFQLLGGKKVYLWTLEAFTSSGLFDEIILVAPPDQTDLVKTEVDPDIQVVSGGATRQESSYRGLIACGSNTDIVVIHDGVRPFVSKRILEDNIAGARNFGAVDTCIPTADTLVHAPSGNRVASIPPRLEYLRGQTPQSFSYPLILEAHQKTHKMHATDDCQLVLEMKKDVHVVKGDEENIKITTPFDLILAETKLQLLKH